VKKFKRRGGGYHLFNAKNLIFFKTPNVHSFVDGGSRRLDYSMERTYYDGKNGVGMFDY
jgi:hypothetical protein